MFPLIAHAAEIDVLVSAVNKHVINPIIMLLMVIAFVVFIFGLIEFMGNSASDDARTKGKKHMIYGIVGLFIMVSALGIMSLITGTLGNKDQIDVRSGEVKLDDGAALPNAQNNTNKSQFLSS
ncbi:MAG: putative membrane protein [Flavobacteriaceae bacterium]|jgi:uncharacterized membrane protein